MSDVTVTNNTDKSRYEAVTSGRVAGFAEYRLGEGTIEFPHTVVDDEFAGRGIASTLARTALEAARTSQLRVIPTCSFIRGWIDKHPEFQPLVEHGA